MSEESIMKIQCLECYDPFSLHSGNRCYSGSNQNQVFISPPAFRGKIADWLESRTAQKCRGERPIDWYRVPWEEWKEYDQKISSLKIDKIDAMCDHHKQLSASDELLKKMLIPILETSVFPFIIK